MLSNHKHLFTYLRCSVYFWGNENIKFSLYITKQNRMFCKTIPESKRTSLKGSTATCFAGHSGFVNKADMNMMMIDWVFKINTITSMDAQTFKVSFKSPKILNTIDALSLHIYLILVHLLFFLNKCMCMVKISYMYN